MLAVVVSSDRWTSKSSGPMTTGTPGPDAAHGIEQGAVDVDAERVAELVALRVVGELATAPGARSRVPAEALAPQPTEDLGQRLRAELPRGAGGELEAAALAVDVPRLLERLRQVREPIQLVDRVVATEVMQRVPIQPLERVGVARGEELLLHRVVLLLAVDGGERLREPHRLVAGEWIRLAEREVGTCLLEIAGQARHVPAQPIVAQQVVHQLLELGTLLRTHAGEERRHLRRLAVEVLDQLVDRPDPGREVPAVRRHEGDEIVTRVGAAGVLLEQRVEVTHHRPHAVEILRRDALHALAHALEVRLQHLLAQLVADRRERVPRRIVHELVVMQAVQAPGGIAGEGVEAVAPLLAGAAQDLLGHAALVLLRPGCSVERSLLGLVNPALDTLSLEAEHVLEPLAQVVEDRSELAPLQLGLPPRPKTLDDLAQARDVAAPRAANAALHEALKRAAEIAVREKVVGQGLEQVIGIERRKLLGPVPARVANAHAATQRA